MDAMNMTQEEWEAAQDRVRAYRMQVTRLTREYMSRHGLTDENDIPLPVWFAINERAHALTKAYFDQERTSQTRTSQDNADSWREFKKAAAKTVVGTAVVAAKRFAIGYLIGCVLIGLLYVWAFFALLLSNGGI